MARVNLEDISFGDYKIEDFPRLKELRDKQLTLKTEICIERAQYITEYLTKYDDPKDSQIVRRAKAIKHFLSNKKPLIFDNNIIAGTTTSKHLGAPVYPEFIGLTIWPELETISTRAKNPQILTKNESDKLNYDIFPYWMDKSVLEVARKQNTNKASMDLFERIIFFIAGKAGCISHTVPCYEKILKRGLEDIIKEASEKKRLMQTKDIKKYDFYRSIEITLWGIINYARNLSKMAMDLSKKEQNPIKKTMYEKMGKVCAKVPANPATSFIEATNSLWICHIAVHAENINMAISPGRLDQILYEYYKKDISDHKITEKEAIDIIGCLWLKFSDNVNMVPETSEELFGGAGTAPAVTLGGVDKNGNDSVNDLTYTMLKVTELLKIRDPNVNARYNYQKNSEEYKNRVCQVIANTKAVPAFHNDIENIKTLTNQGVTLEHARDYSIIGCVELAESGRGYQASSSIILNLVTPLLLTLYNGCLPTDGNKQISPQTGDISTFTKFGDFYDAYKTQLSWVISNAVSINELLGRVHQQILPTPLLSSMFEGPMEAGLDLINGGAMYNSSGATHVGFADTVDSLCAIYDTVFQKKKWSLQYLLKAIESNFEGEYLEVMTYILNNSPKYGRAEGAPLKLSVELSGFLYRTYQSYSNYRGGRYRPAFWTMTNHSGQGRITCATPNGRKKGTPFASGITPVSGASSNLFDCLMSVSKLGSLNIPGGEALNLKFACINGDRDTEKLGQMIDSYFKLGGQQVQFNIMNYEMLKDAKQNPEKYYDLMVRVSGYSAYYKDLNEDMKDELITRAQYDIETGQFIRQRVER